MTFSIVGFCKHTNMTGVAITTSSICVASRCPWVRAGVGAVATQNVTDPSLGPKLLDAIESGLSAEEGVAKIIREHNEHMDYRQLTVVDTRNGFAHHTGAQILGTHSVATGTDCVAAGNLLSDAGVTQSMVDKFEAESDLHLAERLLQALQAGVDAGGEEGPTHSAGVKIAHVHSWPLVDLRIDWTEEEPVKALHAIWKLYEPQMEDYTTRAVNPSAAPSYGVAGNL